MTVLDYIALWIGAGFGSGAAYYCMWWCRGRAELRLQRRLDRAHAARELSGLSVAMARGER